MTAKQPQLLLLPVQTNVAKSRKGSVGFLNLEATVVGAWVLSIQDKVKGCSSSCFFSARAFEQRQHVGTDLISDLREKTWRGRANGFFLSAIAGITDELHIFSLPSSFLLPVGGDPFSSIVAEGSFGRFPGLFLLRSPSSLPSFQVVAICHFSRTAFLPPLLTPSHFPGGPSQPPHTRRRGGEKIRQSPPPPFSCIHRFWGGAFDTHKFPKNQAHFDPHNKDQSILINKFS